MAMLDQYSLPEDAERLPEGFKRIAYDSDTMKFTFRDCKGLLYQSEAGAEYGILSPISTSTTMLSCSRPHAFSSDTSSVPPARRPPHKQKSTFKDILPSNLITTSSLSERNPDSLSRRSATVKAVRRSVLPKIQGVVHNVRRSVTFIRSKRPTSLGKMLEVERGDETRGLVRSGSPIIGSDIRRSAILSG